MTVELLTRFLAGEEISAEGPVQDDGRGYYVRYEIDEFRVAWLPLSDLLRFAFETDGFGPLEITLRRVRP